MEDTNRHFPPQGWDEQQGKRLDTLSDILSENGKAVSHVLMFGDAGNGKTTYCIWLLKNWCNAQRLRLNERPLNEYENAFLHIDFVFFIPLRHVHPSRSNVTDMICKDVFEMDAALGVTAMQILFSDNYRCLIIMDGLEEWKPDQSAKDNLKYKGMPNMDGVSNSVILTTSRPSKLLDVERSVRDKHRIIEILGIHDDGIESVINKILINLYRIEPGSNDYSRRNRKIISKLERVTSRSFLKNPLLAVVCVQMWNEERQAEDIMTSFYSNIIDMLIERALSKKELKIAEDEENLHIFLPEGLSGNENIKAYLSPLSKLGRVALRTLLSKDKLSVYQHRRFVNELGFAVLQFALDVGLISMTDAPSTDKKNVHVQFLHKSVEEFLSAIHIVTSTEEMEVFCNHLSNVKVIIRLSNVITFIYGMRPSLANIISQRVVKVSGTDLAIYQYRSSPQEGNETVQNLFKLQIKWYREIMYGRTHAAVIKHDEEALLPFSYHVSDVHLSTTSDLETVDATKQLISDANVTISSLFLDVEEERFSNSELNEYLTDANRIKSLTMLFINGMHTNRSLHIVCGPNLKSLWLMNVTLDEPIHMERPVLNDMDRIQNIYMSNLRLNDRDIGVSAHMAQLRMITLDRVSMASIGWLRFVQSLIDIQHKFYVKTRQTDISLHSVTIIRFSQEFKVTKDGIERNGRYFDFVRVWPRLDGDDAFKSNKLMDLCDFYKIADEYIPTSYNSGDMLYKFLPNSNSNFRPGLYTGKNRKKLDIFIKAKSVVKIIRCLLLILTICKLILYKKDIYTIGLTKTKSYQTASKILKMFNKIEEFKLYSSLFNYIEDDHKKPSTKYFGRINKIKSIKSSLEEITNYAALLREIKDIIILEIEDDFISFLIEDED